MRSLVSPFTWGQELIHEWDSMINTLALEEPEEVKEESADEEGASAESTSLSTSANEPHSSEDEGPPSFLSPLQPIAQPAKEESEGEDMMSSIYAIHRPIAARRRTVTGEEGECVKEGRYAAQRVRSGTTDTMDSGKSASRRQKLAEKLEDVFGIEGGEEVLAGEFLELCTVSEGADEFLGAQSFSAGCFAPFCCRASCT